MEIFLVRHGQTDGNKKRVFQGNLNIPLNDTGREQALCTKEKITGIKFDNIYTSPLIRASETAKIITSGIDNVKIIEDDRIREISFGDVEGIGYDEVDEDFMKFFNKPEEYRAKDNAESFKSLEMRLTDFLQYIKRVNKSDSKVLVVSHGAAIHMIIKILSNGTIEMKNFWKANVDNCSVNRFFID